ncbi:MAG: autotransporter-associated beta strand repeat-containing protein [Thermoguttaceae bacterium]|nr:autotransporter-associated beta strand repeat-containing protein [Thermoguttaceae bacterium]
MKIMRHSFKSFTLFLALLASPVFAEDFPYTITSPGQVLNLTTTAGNTYTVDITAITTGGSTLTGFTYSGNGTVIVKGNSANAGSRVGIDTNNSAFTGTLVLDSVRISGANLGGSAILLQNGGNIMNNAGASNYTQNIQLGTDAGGFKAGWNTTLTLSGVISDYTGVSGVLKDIADNGSVVINNAANTYTGGTIIEKQIDIGTAAANGTPLGTGAVSFSASTAILDLKGQNITIGGLNATQGKVQAGSGSPTLTLNVPNGAEYTYTGAISGAISIVKDGAGTQILGGNAKGYTGKTTVTGGTLKLADGVSSFSAATLNGGTLSVDTSSGITLTVQKDGGTLDWRAGGTAGISVTLKGDETTTADTVFTFQGITNPTGNCNTLNMVSASEYIGKIRLAGGKWNVNGASQLHSGAIILDGGTFMMNSTAGFTVPNNFEVASAGGSFRPGGNPGVYKLTGAITGTGELGISCDNSTVIFANSGNTFSGGLNLGVPYNANGNSAVVKLGANNALGSGLVTVTNSGAKLDLAGYSVTTRPIAGLSTTLAAADIKNSSSTASTLTLDVPSGTEYSYVGKLSGKINLVKNGAGTQKLSGSGITFSGLLTVSDGTLDLPGVTLSALTGLSGSSASAILKNSKTDGTTNLTLNTTSDQSYAGQISGKFSITKTGSAKQTLDGSKLDGNFAAKISAGTLALTKAPATQNGSYTLDGGTLNVSTSETTAVKLGTALKTTANGGTVVFNPASGTPRLELGTLSGNGDANTVVTLTTKDNATGNCPSFYFTVPASYLGKVEVTGGKWVITNGSALPKAGVILSGGEIMGGDGNPDITSTVTLAEGKLSTLRSGFSKSVTVSGQITGAGQLGIATDSGTVILKNSANDFSGGLIVGTTKNSNVGQGTLKAGAENVFGTGSLTVLSASNQNSVDLNGFNQTVGGLSSDGTNALVYDSTASLADLRLNVPVGQSFTYNGILRDVDLVKTGFGTQTISGALTGVGDVQVQAGTLEMADQSYDLAGTSISLSDNAVLALNDVTITNLDFLGMTDSSVIKPMGDMFSVAINSFLGDTGTLTWDGTTLGGNLSYYLISNGDGGYVLDSSAVPEPSAWLLLLLGLGLIIRRKKSL